MMRWLIVGAVVALSALLLYSVRAYSADYRISDELLAHEVKPDVWVEFLLPGKTDQLLLSSWCVIPEQSEYLLEKSYDYGVAVVVEDVNGRVALQQKLRFASRISGDPRQPTSEGRFSARLLDAAAWVSDARSSVLDTSALRGSAGRVRLKALPGKYPRVLIRVGRPEKRSELERAVLERSLTLSERRSFVSERSALGFGDLPDGMRGVALAEWGRRLTAVGREGRDYHTRRLLLGGHHTLPTDELEEDAGVVVGPKLSALFNLRGPVTLRVHAQPGTEIAVRDGTADEYGVLVGQSGKLDVALQQTGVRTTSISAPRLTELGFTLSADDARRVLGEPPLVVRGARVALKPDVRIQYYLSLDRTRPVVYSLAPGQTMVGLNIRSTMASGAEGRQLELSWLGSRLSLRSETIRVLEPEFGNDTVDRKPVSDPQRVLLRVPRDAERLEVSGGPELAIALWTPEPGVSEGLLEAAYDVELPPNHVWRNAPYALSRVAPLRADEHDALAVNGRLLRVATQVRIEELGPGIGRRVVERVLETPMPGRARRFFRRSYHPRGTPFPQNGWMLLSDRELNAVVPTAGQRAQRLEVLYRVPPNKLGSTLELFEGDTPLHSQRLQFSTGRFVVASDAGDKQLRLDGLGAEGLAFARVEPKAGASIYQLQSFHELSPERPFVFRFERRQGELLSIILFVASDDASRRFRLEYRLIAARDALRLGRAVRRITELEGSLPGRTNERLGFFWDAVLKEQANNQPDYVGRVRIAIGDDLQPGWYQLRLKADTASGPGSLWLRAVVAGRRVKDAEEAF